MITYLAGPIFGCTDDESSNWREHAKTYLGAENCLDPMRRDYRGREQDAEAISELVVADKHDILASDGVLANCWQVSWGTAMEIHFSYHCGKPVIAVVPPGTVISPWLRYHTARICSDLDVALSLLS